MTPLFFMDAAEPWQYGFQDPGTPVMEGIINFHHDVMFFLIVVVIAVAWIMGRICSYYGEDVNPVPSNVVHGTFMEIVWTIPSTFINGNCCSFFCITLFYG